MRYRALFFLCRNKDTWLSIESDVDTEKSEEIVIARA